MKNPILLDLAKEINQDWSFEYTAEVANNVLKVYYLKDEVVIRIDDDLNITHQHENHKEAVEQLEYMLTR